MKWPAGSSVAMCGTAPLEIGEPDEQYPGRVHARYLDEDAGMIGGWPIVYLRAATPLAAALLALAKAGGR